MKRRKRLSLTMRLVLTFGLVMLTANAVLGLVSLNRTKYSMQTLIDKNMQDITNSAAALVDGDVLAALTEADVGSGPYQEILWDLSVFQNNADIRFIYAVRRDESGKFVFVVDPDPEEPAEFGEEIVVTSGLLKAGEGVPAVDDAPMADRWGNFYSAYSPVFDSKGELAGVIGIDFDADWYEDQVRRHTLAISAISTLSVLIGGAAVFMITHSVRRRFQQLDADLSGLSKGVDELMEEVISMSGLKRGENRARKADFASDELEVLGEKLHGLQEDMGVYLDYMHRQAYVDSLTKVGNSAAYHGAVDALEARMAGGDARFGVAVFDINNLKQINDCAGHQKGDVIIRGAADCLSKVFGAEHTFRIGGDEFAVVAEGMSGEEMARKLVLLDGAIEAFNRDIRPLGVSLAISRGTSFLQPGVDRTYKEVFARADEMMYEDKKAFYERTGNRRRGTGE